MIQLTPQAFASIAVGIISIIITMGLLFAFLRSEKKNQSSNRDDH